MQQKNCERLPSPIENGKEKRYFYQCELSLEQHSHTFQVVKSGII